MFRPALLLLLLLPATLGGCAAAVVAAGVEAGSVAVFGRGVVDIGVSAVTGRDCSVVHLDRREDYCAPREAVAETPYCTRTLGVAQCWANPDAFGTPPRQLADNPALTRTQLRSLRAPWPKSLALTE